MIVLAIVVLGGLPGLAAAQSAVWDMRVVNSNSPDACPAGWERKDFDLNRGTEGDAVYLCLNRSNGSVSDEGGVIYFSAPIEGIIICVDECPASIVKVAGNLNEGTTGRTLYYGYFRG